MSARNVFSSIWNSLMKSFKVKPERLLGEFKGEDYLGNKYYELPPDPRGGRSRASRWFECESGDLTQELPPEWMAWLRRRRDEPPTKEEIIRNLAISQMKKRITPENVKSNCAKSSFEKPKYQSMYPHYGNEYEKYPGQRYDSDK